jgi:hypothetical protein
MSSLNSVFGSSPYTNKSTYGGSIASDLKCGNKMSAYLEMGAMICLVILAFVGILTNTDSEGAKISSAVLSWTGLLLLGASNVYSLYFESNSARGAVDSLMATTGGDPVFT